MSLGTDSLLMRIWLKRQPWPTPRVCYADFWRGNCIWRWLISRDRKKKGTQLPKWDVSKDTSEYRTHFLNSHFTILSPADHNQLFIVINLLHTNQTYKSNTNVMSFLDEHITFSQTVLSTLTQTHKLKVKQTSLSSISVDTHNVCIIDICMSYDL